MTGRPLFAAASFVKMSAVMKPMRETRVLEGVEPDRIPHAELMASNRPAILRGVARHWPLVRRGREGAGPAVEYLRSFATPKPVVVYAGPPDIGGRFAYDAGLTGFNFERSQGPLAQCLERLLEAAQAPEGPSLYVGSTDVEIYLPNFRAQNDLVLDDGTFVRHPPTVSIWLGNRTVAAAHFDQSHNLACCAVGHRRFTMFPPDQIGNLYPGPLEPTPGGQVVSLVDFRAPDFERFPRFRDALAAGEVAELEPGDVVFCPALWWHHVEALDGFNALVNYWWNTGPAFLDSPQITLLHALMSLRDRNAAEKAAWREVFDYYVFGEAGRAAAHLPDRARGELAPMDDVTARRLRAKILARLNR
jgi:hypothetical protein